MQKFYFTLLIIFSFLISQSQDMFISGSAIPSWWTNPDPIPNISLIDNGDGTYYKTGLEFEEGFIRFYEAQDLEINFGGTAFPEGQLADQDLFVQEGFYDVYLDMNTNTYYFESYPQVSFYTFNTSNSVSFGMNTSDYEIFSQPVTQFYDGLGWFSVNIHPFVMEYEDYGGDDFPSGNLISFNQPVEVESGFYEVTLDYTNLTFSFDVPEVSIIGSALVNNEAFNENSTQEYFLTSSHGALYTLNNVELQEGELQFRQNQNWDVYWGGNSFPSGDLTINGESIEVNEAGIYNISFDRENLSYIFTSLSTENPEFNYFKVYPNPTKQNWYISSHGEIEEVAIYSITGNLLTKLKTNGVKKIKLNSEKYASGIYIAKLTSFTGDFRTIKLIKQE
jgi:hypothetical protein